MKQGGGGGSCHHRYKNKYNNLLLINFEKYLTIKNTININE